MVWESSLYPSRLRSSSRNHKERESINIKDEEISELIDNAKNLVESLEITISNLKPKIEYSSLSSSDDFPF